MNVKLYSEHGERPHAEIFTPQAEQHYRNTVILETHRIEIRLSSGHKIAIQEIIPGELTCIIKNAGYETTVISKIFLPYCDQQMLVSNEIRMKWIEKED